VPDELKAQNPDIDWRGMVDFGNELRHAYHRVDPIILWQTAHRDLPPLQALAERAIDDEK
jgi:uncharacterized protein with HEPN domain